MHTAKQCLIHWHKRFDLTKRFLSFIDMKKDRSRQKRHNKLRYVTMKCDKVQKKTRFMVLILLHNRANFCFILPQSFGIIGDV